MGMKEKKWAAKGKIRVLFHSVDTGDFRGFCDMDHGEVDDRFFTPFNDPHNFSPVTAVGVTDRGYCLYPMKVHADSGKYAVISQIAMCENEILTQHDTLDEAVEEAIRHVKKLSHATQGLGGWGVIDDRGVILWRDAPHYHAKNRRS
jgi:hypothetical protein